MIHPDEEWRQFMHTRMDWQSALDIACAEAQTSYIARHNQLEDYKLKVDDRSGDFNLDACLTLLERAWLAERNDPRPTMDGGEVSQ